ncbi:MAG TPA: hypothetical protein VI796_02430 [Candidatus Thermoplasmatota archaeon]|nr:hypothetical protein [Candidatus Thermoplasmatota archaeon]
MLQEGGDFKARVVEHYRAKGYEVRENVKVRGASGNVYNLPVVAEGQLGALVVSFGDAGGMDPTEMGSIRRIAKDVGATPVLASPEFGPEFRRQAVLNGVVLLDGSLKAGGPSFPLPDTSRGLWPGPQGTAGMDRSELDEHPWPASGRARPEGTSAVAPSDVDDLMADLERKAAAPPPPRAPQPAASDGPRPGGGFGWLGTRIERRAPAPVSPDDIEGPRGELAAEDSSILHAGGDTAQPRTKRSVSLLSGLDRRRIVDILAAVAAGALLAYVLLRLV